MDEFDKQESRSGGGSQPPADFCCDLAGSLTSFASLAREAVSAACVFMLKLPAQQEGPRDSRLFVPKRSSRAPPIIRLAMGSVFQFVLVNFLVSQAFGHCLFDNKPLLQSCGAGCIGVPGAGKETCVSNCLVGKGVRWSCATCLGRGFNCGFNSCLSSCTTGFTKPVCTTCISSNCGLCSSARSIEDTADNASTLEALAELFAGASSAAANSTQELEAEPSTRSGCFEVQSLMKTCGTQCYAASNQASCAATCLAGKGVSAGCANCFGRKISCTIKNCISGCAADANGAACTSCVASKCGSCNAVAQPTWQVLLVPSSMLMTPTPKFVFRRTLNG